MAMNPAKTMKHFIDAAFRPPPDTNAAAPGFAVLPQQTDEDIQLSDTHSRLDRVLNFLIRELGYSFLDDARPGAGGGVRLKAKPAADLPWRVGKKSARFPAGDPSVDDDEARTIKIGPGASRYAKYPEDITLVRRFVKHLVEATPAAAEKVQDEAFYKVVLQGVRLLHLCDFEYSDVVLVLAYASVYFHTTYEAIGSMMSGAEAAHVCTLLIFLAHSFVLDETCPLRCWRSHVFRKYCTLKVLDAALFRLFNLRGFRLRLSVAEERAALAALLHSPAPQGILDVGDASIGAAVAILKGQGSQPQCASECPAARGGSNKDAAGGGGAAAHHHRAARSGDAAAGPMQKDAAAARHSHKHLPNVGAGHPQPLPHSPSHDSSASTAISATQSSQSGATTPPLEL